MQAAYVATLLHDAPSRSFWRSPHGWDQQPIAAPISQGINHNSDFRACFLLCLLGNPFVPTSVSAFPTKRLSTDNLPRSKSVRRAKIQQKCDRRHKSAGASRASGVIRAKNDAECGEDDAVSASKSASCRR